VFACSTGRGWIGPPALELKHSQRASRVVDMPGHSALETRRVNAMPLLHGPCARKLLVVLDVACYFNAAYYLLKERPVCSFLVGKVHSFT
jgi:hypothetical protein